jgi:hypothetical protein
MISIRREDNQGLRCVAGRALHSIYLIEVVGSAGSKAPKTIMGSRSDPLRESLTLPRRPPEMSTDVSRHIQSATVELLADQHE